MNTNEIISEVRKTREKHARRFHFNFEEIVADIQKGEEKLIEEGWKIISKKAKKFIQRT